MATFATKTIVIPINGDKKEEYTHACYDNDRYQKMLSEPVKEIKDMTEDDDIDEMIVRALHQRRFDIVLELEPKSQDETMMTDYLLGAIRKREQDIVDFAIKHELLYEVDDILDDLTRDREYEIVCFLTQRLTKHKKANTRRIT
tara:strand:+ start:381 stop:812 length:432 start_codon:yes stop_codon:yes gene_type:complete